MDIHQNARLTLRSREALVETVNGGLGFSRAAASFHVTPKTAAKWVRRYQAGGPDNLGCPIQSRPVRLSGVTDAARSSLFRVRSSHTVSHLPSQLRHALKDDRAVAIHALGPSL